MGLELGEEEGVIGKRRRGFRGGGRPMDVCVCVGVRGWGGRY